MKRRAPPLLPVCQFLLLGAIVNVAVALALWAWRPNMTEPRSIGQPASWMLEVPSDWPQSPHESWSNHYLGITENYARVLPGAEFPLYFQELYGYGLPLRALFAEHHHVGPASHPYAGADLLPRRALWPGFAINTLFYAAMLWLVFAAPFAIRRRRRIKRGLCPKCAYPIGTNGRCTECGNPHSLRERVRVRA